MTDKFYTNSDAAKRCVKRLEETLFAKSEFSATRVFLEPSAGGGSFIEPLLDLSSRVGGSCVFGDIEPEHDLVDKLDFLTTSHDYTNAEVHVVGNPPFGRCSSLARKFIKTSAAFATSISFILPRSFRRAEFEKSFPLDFFKLFDEEMPEPFEYKGQTRKVNCVFQIWVRRGGWNDGDHIAVIPRVLNEPKKSSLFEFVKANENPDFSILRKGWKVGRTSTDTDVFPTLGRGARFYIRVNDRSRVDEILSRATNAQYPGSTDTIAAHSLTLAEVVNAIDV